MATTTTTTITPTPEEIAYRKSMSISRIREAVSCRDWLTHTSMISDIQAGYNCTAAQADALLDLGVMNGYIEVDTKSGQIDKTLDHPVKAWNKYRITTP